jgi:uncharacterized protein YbjT (DUF2867 family)
VGIRIAIFGGSGLTGFEVVKLSIENKDVEAIYSFGRSSLKLKSDKLFQQALNTSTLAESISLLNIDVAVCCIGTTIKKAGSKEAFRAIDVELPLKIAQSSKEAGIKKFIIQSSIGAGPGAGTFYLKCKTELENKISELEFESTIILRPSLLLGDRKEFRLAEHISSVLMRILNPLLVGKARKYRGINASDVAKAILHLSIIEKSGIAILESDEIQNCA